MNEIRTATNSKLSWLKAGKQFLLGSTPTPSKIPRPQECWDPLYKLQYLGTARHFSQLARLGELREYEFLISFCLFNPVPEQLGKIPLRMLRFKTALNFCLELLLMKPVGNVGFGRLGMSTETLRNWSVLRQLVVSKRHRLKHLFQVIILVLYKVQDKNWDPFQLGSVAL